MVIKRVNPLSAAKIGGLLGVLLGLVIGAIISLAALALGGIAAASSEDAAGGAFAGMLFGAGAVIVLPIFYGCVMFVGGALQAFLYNIAARWTGGVQVDVA